MTDSILARDPASGGLGADVPSSAFGVRGCVWAESGVGAVATHVRRQRKLAEVAGIEPLDEAR